MFSDFIQRRVQYCHQINNFQFYFGGKRIEGIGSDMFLLPVNDLACDAGCANHLRCFQDSKVVITNPNIACDGLVTGGASKLSLLEEFIVYPNPTNRIIYFKNQSSLEVNHLELLDQTGRICYISNNPEYIDIELFNAGVYLLKVVMSDHSVVVRKIIRN